MAVLLTAAAAAILATLHTTLLPGMSLFLVVIGLAIFVDINLAVVFALVAGLLLDALDIHVLGLSSALFYVVAAGAVDIAQAHIRTFSKHPVHLYALAVALIVLVRTIMDGATLAVMPVLSLAGRVAIHLAVAFMLLPLLLLIGERYQEGLRQRGML